MRVPPCVATEIILRKLRSCQRMGNVSLRAITYKPFAVLPANPAETVPVYDPLFTVPEEVNVASTV